VVLEITVDNDGDEEARLTLTTELYELDAAGTRVGQPVAALAPTDVTVAPGASAVANATRAISNPTLWGVAPNQTPNRYQVVTCLRSGVELVDRYETNYRLGFLVMDEAFDV
jgi:beta-galactosidase